MKYMKKYKMHLLSALAFVALMVGAVFAMPAQTALAESTSNYAPKDLFAASVSSEILTPAPEGEETSYVQFSLADEGTVSYRHDLAYKWYAQKGNASYFSMKLTLPELNFSKLSLVFESEQENITKEGKTTNSLHFTSDGTSVSVAVNDGASESVASASEIVVAFVSDDNGQFGVSVNGVTLSDSFKNIGGYGAEYAHSSASNPKTPLTVKAELLEGKETQLVNLIELNGQSFALNAEGEVVDNARPVLVLNEKIKAFNLGHKVSLPSYLVIDVLADSSLNTTRFYAYREAPEEGEAETDSTAKDGEGVDVLSYASIPSTDALYLQGQTSGSTKEHVAIRFTINDNRNPEMNSEDIQLAWYCSETADASDNGLLGYGYIPVLRDENGPDYTCTSEQVVDGDTVTVMTETQAVLDYQAEVNAAASALKAGTGAYFYLPSLRSLIVDDYTDYNSLKFSIFYKSQTSSASQSQTSLSYNTLRFEIAKEGAYSFRVVASDKLSNTIKVFDDEGREVEVTSSNVWELDCIPQFDFTVGYDGAQIENGEKNAIGYIESLYTLKSFEIIALDGYQVEYTLYLFDEEAYKEAGNTNVPTYEEIVANPEAYVAYSKEIQPYDSTIEEDTQEWADSDNDIEWKPDNKTFRPQEAGYYIVKADVSDVVFPTRETTAYQAVDVRNNVDKMESQTAWLENNITSVVLFSVAGALLIAIVAMWLVKPSKKVEEVEAKDLKGKKK